ncbi:MAG TPA: hypothetical protein VHC21_01755 [Candidatus Saccharimonadales bacterium]|nr:hypothetical protein [Candidatus Saccharimonadales bacterium]
MAKKVPILFAAVIFMMIGAIFASSASAASWTVLGGAPLFPGGIPNAKQQGRNKFVHDMLSHKGVLAQKRAGMNKLERQAFKRALVRGEFKQCRLHVGDRFEFMAYGVGTILVDRNVTFGDPRYKGKGAPAFCLSVEVSKAGVLLKLKVPFKCENLGGNREKLAPAKPKKRKPKQKPKKPKPKSTPETPSSSPPPVTPPSEQPRTEPEMPYIHLETIQELETEEVRVICAHVESPNNDPVTVHFEAEYGEFANSGTGSAVSGGRSCATYTAPPELPESYWSAEPADLIEAIVWDTVTGKSAWYIEIVKIIPQTKY